MKNLRPVSLATALVAILALSCPSRAATGALQLLPEDTELLIGINLKGIRASPLWQAQQGADEPAADLLGRLLATQPICGSLREGGLNVVRDVDRLTGAFAQGKDKTWSLLILEGRIDAERLNAAVLRAKAAGAVVQSVDSGGATVHELALPGRSPGYASFLAPSTLLCSTDRQVLNEARARATGAKQGMLKKEFGKLLEDARAEESIRIVATGPVLSRLLESAALPNTERACTFLKSVSAISSVVTLRKDVEFRLAIATESEEAALKLAVSANSGARILRTVVEQGAEQDARLHPLVEIVKTLRFTSEGSVIRLQGEVRLQTLEGLVTAYRVRGQP